MAKSDKTETVVERVIVGLNSLAESFVAVYTSVNVARMKADVFSAAYAAHIRNGQLPEEAASLALKAAHTMYSTVSAE